MPDDTYPARTRYVDQGVVDEYERARFSGPLGRYVWRREQRAVGAMVAAAGPARRVLDCPAGYGRWVPVLHRSAPELIVEADVSSTMLAAGRSRIGLPATRCEAERLPFADSSFDVVFCHALMKHLPPMTQAAVLAELGRVSSHAVVCAFSVETVVPKAFRRLRGKGRQPVSRPCSPGELEAMAGAAGLRVVASRSCTTPVGMERSVLMVKLDPGPTPGPSPRPASAGH